MTNSDPRPVRVRPKTRAAASRAAASRAAVLSMLVFALSPAMSFGVAAQEPATPEPAVALDTAQLIGQVVSAIDGRVIGGAVVSLLRSGMGAISDSSGNFNIPMTIAGTDTLEVRFVGYESGTVELYLEPDRVTRVVLLLSPTTVRVADLNVEIERSDTPALYAGFYRRKKRGIGHFITPEQLARRRPRYTSDMLRSVPGLAVGATIAGRAKVTVTRELIPCEPVVFIDGLYVASMPVDDILADAPHPPGSLRDDHLPALLHCKELLHHVACNDRRGAWIAGNSGIRGLVMAMQIARKTG